MEYYILMDGSRFRDGIPTYENWTVIIEKTSLLSYMISIFKYKMKNYEGVIEHTISNY